MIWREKRYLARQLKVSLGTIALILVVDLVSERMTSTAWPELALEFPSIHSGSAEDIIGRATVINGDTLEIHGQRIRLWGVDAPERDQHCLPLEPNGAVRASLRVLDYCSACGLVDLDVRWARLDL